MKFLIFLTLCVLSTFAADNVPAESIKSDVVASNVPLTSPLPPITVTFTSTTTKPTLPTNGTTTTTPKPTSSSTTKPTTKPTPPPTLPPTTTTKPTTSTSAPTTSTLAPTTSTSAPTTPGPIPDPTAGQWSVNITGTNKTCIVLDVAMQIAIPYKDEKNKTADLLIDVPPLAKANGNCSGDLETLTLNWDEQNSITFNFNKTNKDKSYNLESVLLTVNVTVPGQAPQVLNLIHNKTEFSTPLTKAYKCLKVQSFDLTKSGDNATLATLQISKLQVEAFRNATGTGFSDVMDCADAGTPDVVPIAVGCALAALVIIVLIAYLIGRRRSQARGYLSM